MCPYIYLYMHACMHACMHAYMQPYVHTYMHGQTDRYTYKGCLHGCSVMQACTGRYTLVASEPRPMAADHRCLRRMQPTARP